MDTRNKGGDALRDKGRVGRGSFRDIRFESLRRGNNDGK